MRFPLVALRILLLSALLVASCIPPPAAASLVSDADHWQTCAPNLGVVVGAMCAFASVNWILPGGLVIPNGAFLSDNTGFTPVFLQIVGQLVLAGVPVPGDHAQPTVYPGSGVDVYFINGDEDYPDLCPDLVPCAPFYAAGLDCVAESSDSGAPAEFNDGTAVGPADVVASYVLNDALRDLLGVTGGPLYVDESGVISKGQQVTQWVSNVIEVAVPGTVKEVKVQVDFTNPGGVCDARDVPVVPATIGPVLAVGWVGVVSDFAVFGS